MKRIKRNMRTLSCKEIDKLIGPDMKLNRADSELLDAILSGDEPLRALGKDRLNFVRKSLAGIRRSSRTIGTDAVSDVARRKRNAPRKKLSLKLRKSTARHKRR